MTKLCSGHGNPDADDDTAEAGATADESNPYMSPFQATQKRISGLIGTGVISESKGVIHVRLEPTIPVQNG